MKSFHRPAAQIGALALACSFGTGFAGPGDQPAAAASAPTAHAKPNTVVTQKPNIGKVNAGGTVPTFKSDTLPHGATAKPPKKPKKPDPSHPTVNPTIDPATGAAVAR